MAGVKGKSGGARKGAGGARPGAGRKPKVPKAESANEQAGAVEVTLEPQPHGGALKRSESVPVPTSESDMLQLLKDIAMGKIEASPIQVRAAIAAVQYTHAKVGEGGKKEQAKEKAAEVAQGRFGSRKPPLSVVH